MNFIIRNLGWILLIIFFMFMLYLISNQNNTWKVTNIEGKSASLVQSGSLLTSKESSTQTIKNNETSEDDVMKEVAKLLKVNTITNDWTESSYTNEEMDKLLLKEEKSIELNKTKLAKEDSGVIDSVRNFFTINSKNGWTEEDASVKKSISFNTKTGNWVVTTSEKESKEVKEVNEALIKEVDRAISEGNNEEESKKMIINVNSTGDKTGLKSQISEEAIIGKSKTNNIDILDNFKKTIWINWEKADKDSDDEGENKYTEAKEADIDVSKKDDAKKMEGDKKSKNETRQEVTKVSNAKLSNTKKEKKKSAKITKASHVLANYTIWVNAMKLNNAWFTKKLWTVYKWDTVKQLTKTNKYWCFKIEVEKSQDPKNNGKIAWACKYYMEWHTETLAQYVEVAQTYYAQVNTKAQKKVPVQKATKHIAKKVHTKKVTPKMAYANMKKMTPVWTMHIVNTAGLKLNNAYFNKTLAYLVQWDELEQLTSMNSYGCFRWVVAKSHNPYTNNKWKLWWVCNYYLDQK